MSLSVVYMITFVIVLILGYAVWYFFVYLKQEEQMRQEEQKEDYARACHEYKVDKLKSDFKRKYNREYTDEEYYNARRRCGSYDDTNILNWLLLYTVVDGLDNSSTSKYESTSCLTSPCFESSSYTDSLGFESKSYSYEPSTSSSSSSSCD